MSSYRYSQPVSPGFRLIEYGVIALIILAELVGLVGGYIVWHGPWGSIAGVICTMLCAVILCYTLGALATALKVRRFLQSERGRFILGRASDYEAFVSRERTTNDT